MKYICAAEFRENTDKRRWKAERVEVVRETIAKKVITFQRTITKKVVSFLGEKYGETISCRTW